MKKLVLIACGLVSLLCITAFVKNAEPAPGDDEKMIALRNVGHKVLQQSGDNTTNLPPVKKLGNNVFEIGFTNPLTFISDSLVASTSEAFDKTGIANEYLVKVVNSATAQMVYGYEVSGKPGASIIPCRGRSQPKANYSIIIAFGKPGVLAGILQGYTLPSLGLLLTLLSAAIVLFYKQKPMPATETVSDSISIGHYTLLPAKAILQCGDENTPLTVKEIKVLTLFARQPGNVITREELVKHIWGDEGIVTGGRSLDVFVSKLRKKFTADPAVSFVNVHGVGYKLQVE